MITLKDCELNNYKNVSAMYVKSTGLPYWDYRTRKWNNSENPDKSIVYVSTTVAKRIKQPVQEGEKIVGFTRVMHGYIPLYNRPQAVDLIEDAFYKIIK